MAGIYVHIPYCKQACHYCDFHFSTNYRNVHELIATIKTELQLQRHFFDDQQVHTLYFGGGTPSSVDVDLLHSIVQEVRKLFVVDEELEITLEANPDDLVPEAIVQWKSIGVNRLSIGVQSFVESHLKWMNRAHSRQQALDGIAYAQQAGITNITMDLIYGIPQMTMEEWKQNVQQFFKLGIPHLSAYGLTIESNTHLGHLAQKHAFNPATDEQYNAQFLYLMEAAKQHGYDHYEISNFALPGHHSKHNTAYWFGAPYLGIGPSAHSYKGNKRYWNVASNTKYIAVLN
jgi:oxygen-independent coproporphyrinogen-3 oxidase